MIIYNNNKQRASLCYLITCTTWIPGRRIPGRRSGEQLNSWSLNAVGMSQISRALDCCTARRCPVVVVVKGEGWKPWKPGPWKPGPWTASPGCGWFSRWSLRAERAPVLQCSRQGPTSTPPKPAGAAAKQPPSSPSSSRPAVSTLPNTLSICCQYAVHMLSICCQPVTVFLETNTRRNLHQPASISGHLTPYLPVVIHLRTITVEHNWLHWNHKNHKNHKNQWNSSNIGFN